MKAGDACFWCQGHPKHEGQRYEHEWIAKKLDEAYNSHSMAVEILMEWGKCECRCDGLMPCVHQRTADYLRKVSPLVENILKARKE